MHAHLGGSWDIPNKASEPDKARWLVKGNPEEMPHKTDSNYHEAVTLSLWSCPCIYPHALFFFQINSLLVSLFSIFVGILWGHFLQPGLSQLQYLPSKDSGLAVPSKKGDHERQGGQPSTRSKATPLGSSPETLPSPMFLPKKAAGHTEGKTIVLSFFFFFYHCYWETLLLSNFPVYFKNCLWRLLNHMRGKKKTFQQQLIARLLP